MWNRNIRFIFHGCYLDPPEKILKDLAWYFRSLSSSWKLDVVENLTRSLKFLHRRPKLTFRESEELIIYLLI